VAHFTMYVVRPVIAESVADTGTAPSASYGLHLQLHCCKFINSTYCAELRDVVTLLIHHWTHSDHMYSLNLDTYVRSSGDCCRHMMLNNHVVHILVHDVSFFCCEYSLILLLFQRFMSVLIYKQQV